MLVGGMTNRSAGWGYAFFVVTLAAIALASTRALLYGRDVPFSVGFAVGAILYLAANSFDNGLNPATRLLHNAWGVMGFPSTIGAGGVISSYAAGSSMTTYRQVVDIEYFRFMEMGHCVVAVLVGVVCGTAAQFGQQRCLRRAD
jgi:hypothetical protein